MRFFSESWLTCDPAKFRFPGNPLTPWIIRLQAACIPQATCRASRTNFSQFAHNHVVTDNGLPLNGLQHKHTLRSQQTEAILVTPFDRFSHSLLVGLLLWLPKKENHTFPPEASLTIAMTLNPCIDEASLLWKRDSMQTRVDASIILAQPSTREPPLLMSS